MAHHDCQAWIKASILYPIYKNPLSQLTFQLGFLRKYELQVNLSVHMSILKICEVIFFIGMMIKIYRQATIFTDKLLRSILGQSLFGQLLNDLFWNVLNIVFNLWSNWLEWIFFLNFSVILINRIFSAIWKGFMCIFSIFFH